jgi:hypothetical protein
MAKPTLEQYAQTLADSPPKDFVRARNTLAGELKAVDPTLAHEVRALHRPSSAAWALGQVAKHEHEIMRLYLDATDNLIRVQMGRTKGGDTGEAVRLEREARQALVRHAGIALQKVSINLTPTLRRQLLDTALGAATGDKVLRDALAAGKLRTDVSPVRDLAELGLTTKLRTVPLAREMPTSTKPRRKERLAATSKPRLRLVESTPTRDEHAFAKHLERERERAAKRAELEKAREARRAASAARKEEAAARARALEEAKAALRAAEVRAKTAQAEVKRQRAALAASTRATRRKPTSRNA